MNSPLSQAAPWSSVTLAGKAYLLALIAALFFFSGSLDPDYESYRLVYELGGGHLREVGRDPAFVFIVEQLSSSFTYEAFRYLLACIFAIGLWKLASRLALASQTEFGFWQAAFLTPIVMLKFHVQVREGLALLLWLLAVTNHRRGVGFFLLAVVSCAIHLGVTILWLAAARPWRMRSIVALFSMYGFASTPFGRDLLFQPFLDDPSTLIRDTGFGVDITSWKVVYWSLFFVLPVLVILMYDRKTIDSTLGRVGAWGLAAFAPVAFLLGLTGGIGEGEFANILRIANTLLLVLAIQLSMTRPGWALTNGIGIFLVADVTRLLLHIE